MATIMSLPDEVIIIILEKLSIEDTINFNSTCEKFRQTKWGNTFWIKKFYQRWPMMKKIHARMTSEDLQQIDFEKELKVNAIFAKEMWEFIDHIFTDNLKNDDKKDLISKFLRSNVYSTNYFLLLDEFKRMFSQSARKPGHDLTRRFNSYIIFRLLKHSRTKYKYLKFMNKPNEKQFLEQLVTIVVQWFTPLNHISYTHIQELLDKIAQEVLQALKEKYPTHPILTLDNEYYIYWKTNNINYSHWNYMEILPISSMTEKIIFSQAYFQKLNQLWLKHLNQDVNNISNGSERLFLIIIFHSLLRRFGIYSLVIEGCSIQIFFKPTGNTNYYSLDLKRNQFCLVPNNSSVEGKFHHKTITKLVDYLDNELHTLHPGEIIMLNRMLLRQNVNVSDIMMWFCDSTIPRKKVPEERSRRLKFVIGTIVNHKCIDQIHVGVIVGWTLYYYPPACMMSFNNFPLYSNLLCTDWQCENSKCNVHKPYYIILCDNTSYCYVEYENVWICDSPRWINHSELGRYFYRFEGNYYMPNKMLEKDYPSDVAIINEMRHYQLH